MEYSFDRIERDREGTVHETSDGVLITITHATHKECQYFERGIRHPHICTAWVVRRSQVEEQREGEVKC